MSTVINQQSMQRVLRLRWQLRAIPAPALLVKYALIYGWLIRPHFFFVHTFLVQISRLFCYIPQASHDCTQHVHPIHACIAHMPHTATTNDAASLKLVRPSGRRDSFCITACHCHSAPSARIHDAHNGTLMNTSSSADDICSCSSSRPKGFST